jgi:DNA-binding LytR/AlgR family response regulator
VKSNHHFPDKVLLITGTNLKRIMPAVAENTEGPGISSGLIRFEVKREQYCWIHPDEIIFVISADHYVKSLINLGKEKKWMIRHATLKELIVDLPRQNFIRLNRFYLINLNFFSSIKERIIYLNDGYTIPVPHRISPYILSLLERNNT